MESLKILLELIFQRFLQPTYCLTIISDTSQDLLTTNLPSVRLNKADFNGMFHATNIGCSDYVIQTENPDAFMASYKKVHRLSNTRKGDRKLIFLPTNENAGFLLRILSEKELTFIPNLLLIIPKMVGKCLSYELMTHRFTGRDERRIKDPILLDRWNGCDNKFEWNANLFPYDMKDLYGKVMRVACFTYKPFVMLDLDEKITPGGKDGIDIRIVEEFCRWVNCTIDLVTEDKFQWGVVYPNGTGIGALGDVAEDRADLGITSMGQWYSSYKSMDLSAYCLGCAVHCIVPSPRLLSRWELPFLAFSVSMWIASCFMILYATVALYFAQGCYTRNAWLITVGISLAQPQNYLRNWRVRSVLAGLVVTSLLINAAYSSGLASIFTVPNYAKSIDTMEDLIDSGITWAAPHDAWTYSMLPSTEPKIQKLLRQFRKYSQEELKRRSYQTNMAYAIEKLPAGYIAIGSYLSHSVLDGYQVMLEDFYSEYSIVTARKGSAYIGRMNEMIGRMHETGILLAWETHVALKYLDYKVQLAVKFSRIKSPPKTAPLTFNHVMGVFIVHGTGMCVSIVLFISEVIRGRNKRKSNINRNT